MPRAVCIGAAAVDRKYTVRGEVVPGTSNPATVRRSFGGVARNVAENLAHLGIDAGLVSIIGVDHNALLLRRHLNDAGVDVRHLAVSSVHPTAEYVAILDRDGSLVVGVADMAIFDDFSLDDLANVQEYLCEAQWVFADCNLPAAILRGLVTLRRSSDFRLAIDAVSVAKAQRLPNDLETVDLLFLNEDEAGVSFASIKSARAVVVGRGANGVAIVEADAETTLPAAPCDPRDETGAGDALIAATIAALIEGRGLRAGVADGIHRAARTIESADTVVGR